MKASATGREFFIARLPPLVGMSLVVSDFHA
jgi:hypothetical protein